MPGSPMTFSKDLSFSGRVFLYTMNPLDPMQIGELVSSYRKDGLLLEIRGSDYLFCPKQNLNLIQRHNTPWSCVTVTERTIQ